jgi:hypothetical protein
MNIISVRSIEIAAQVAASRARRKVVKDWLERALQRYIRKTPELHERVKMRFQIEEELRRNSNKKGWKPPENLREKLIAALDIGEPLYVFVDMGPGYHRLLEQARLVTDWLDAVPEWDRHLKRIDRMSYAEAVRMAVVWHEKLLTLAADADDPDVVEEIEVVEDCGDGCRFVELKGPVALLREGRLMGHCVGSYFPNVQAGQARIFSLRDARNQPHVTIEVRREARGGALEASQVKGRGNRAPVERWAAYCRKFIISHDWHVSYDGNNIGLVTIQGRGTFEDPDEILNAVLDTTDAAKLAKLRLGTLSQLFGRDVSVQSILLRRVAEIRPETRRRLFDLTAIKPTDVAFETDATLLQGPKGATIQRRRFEIGGSFLQAFRFGFFAGLENEVADVLTPIFNAMQAAISTEPHHVWEIAVKGNPTSAALIEQIAAYVGQHKALIDLRERVRAVRGESAMKIRSEIRRETGRGDRGETPPEGGWALQLAMFERLNSGTTKVQTPAAFVM